MSPLHSLGTGTALLFATSILKHFLRQRSSANLSDVDSKVSTTIHLRCESTQTNTFHVVLKSFFPALFTHSLAAYAWRIRVPVVIRTVASDELSHSYRLSHPSHTFGHSVATNFSMSLSTSSASYVHIDPSVIAKDPILAIFATVRIPFDTRCAR